MIKVLGTRRLSILIALLGLNCLLAAAVYMIFLPQNERLQTQLTQLNGKVSASRSHTEVMRNQFNVIQEQKAEFEKLQKTEFFTAQDRVEARERFADIQHYSGVLLASYDIKPATVERTEALTGAGQVMLNTPVDVSVDALDDMDFYNFLFLVKNTFPGYTGLNTIELNRSRELDDVALRQIGSGVPTVMIKAKFNFTWKTIVPEKQLEVSTAQQAGAQPPTGATPRAGM